MPPARIYTVKELIMMEKYIARFCTSFYITEIQKLALHLQYVRILGTHHCVNTCGETFKNMYRILRCFCCHDYADIVVASFTNQIQFTYCSVNISGPTEGIVLDNLSTTTDPKQSSAQQSCTCNAVF